MDHNALRSELQGYIDERFNNKVKTYATVQPLFGPIVNSIQRSSSIFEGDTLQGDSISNALNGAEAVRTEITSTAKDSLLTPSLGFINSAKSLAEGGA